VKLSEQNKPSSHVMHASCAGGPDNVRATVTINLEPNGEGTALTYSADAVVGGPVAGIGQRMISGVAKRMAGQFFKAIDDELTGARVLIATGPSTVATGGEAVAAPAAAGPQVFAGEGGIPAGMSRDVQTLALGAVGGAVLTLIGVLVGYRLGRRG
jgi:hypothetical protein